MKLAGQGECEEPSRTPRGPRRIRHKKVSMKIAHIVGARPQFVKFAPVSWAIEKMKDTPISPIKNLVIHTGQHYDYAMSEIFFKDLEIQDPDYHLGVGSGPHGMQTGMIIQKVEEILTDQRPDVVVVYGDTNSTLGGALAAVKLHIPIGHVEAGLRSFNKRMPEEVNRVLTDHVSTVLFCPTEIAAENLHREGFREIVNDGKYTPNSQKLKGCQPEISTPLVINVGDVMYDLMIRALEMARGRSSVLKDHNLEGGKYYVLTLHRAENTDDEQRLEKIISFVNEVAAGIPVIFPVHPRTRKALAQIRNKFVANIRMIDPLGYFDMVWLAGKSALILTDSGGLQKEAYWLKVPCITLREETEWVETVKSGWNVLYRNYAGAHYPSHEDEPFYGDGKTAEIIVSALKELFDRENG